MVKASSKLRSERSLLDLQGLVYFKPNKNGVLYMSLRTDLEFQMGLFCRQGSERALTVLQPSTAVIDPQIRRR